MSRYASGYTGPMTTAGSTGAKKVKSQPTRPTPMPKESMLPGKMGMAKGGAVKKGMAKGGMVKKGMAKGGMTKKGYK